MGKRFLVVEDEFLVGLLLEDVLVERGHVIVGPFNSLSAALVAAEQESFEAAILDINLHGETVFPVAKVLRNRGIPFIFLSGYTHTPLPDEFTAEKRLNKPLDPVALENAIKTLNTKVAG